MVAVGYHVFPVGNPHPLEERYDMGIVVCAWCATPITASGRRRFHSDSCRQAAYRARHRFKAVMSDLQARRVEIVYECPRCESRYLGIRRCPECNIFCARVGAGGACPHCDEPVAHSDLAS